MTASKHFRRNVTHAVKTSLGLSVRAWAVKHKIPTTTLYNVLQGAKSPTLETLEIIAKALKVEVWQLLTPDLDIEHPPTLHEALASIHEVSLDVDLLAECFKVIEQVDENARAPETKAKILAYVYLQAVRNGREPSPGSVRDLLTLVG